MKTTFQRPKPRIVQYRDYTQFFNDNFKKILLENLCLENIYTNSNALAKFLQIYMNTLDQMTPRKKYILDNCHFLIKYCLAHTNKNATKKSLSQKKNLIKITGFILNNKIFVFLCYEKLKKKALFEFK